VLHRGRYLPSLLSTRIGWAGPSAQGVGLQVKARLKWRVWSGFPQTGAPADVYQSGSVAAAAGVEESQYRVAEISTT